MATKLFGRMGVPIWTRPLFHKTLKMSLHRLAGLCKDVFMFYETESWTTVLCSKFQFGSFLSTSPDSLYLEVLACNVIRLVLAGKITPPEYVHGLIQSPGQADFLVEVGHCTACHITVLSF